MSIPKPEISSTPETGIIIVTTESESSAVSDLSVKGQGKVSTHDRTEIVMDLSMKKKRQKLSSSTEQAEQAAPASGDAVKVEMIPSAFEVKISELIINADKKQTEINEGGGGGDSLTERKLETTQRPKRAKKRKQAPEKIIQGCKGSDYVISEQQDLPTTEIVIETTDADNDGFVTKGSNGDTVHVETILEVETSKPAIAEESDDKEDGVSLPLKVPTVIVTSSSSSVTDSPSETAATELPLTQLQSSIFNSSVLGSNAKPMRPFKLYTQNRDLLAGIGLNPNNMNTLAAALSGRPLASSAIVASTASLPITAFAPLNMKNPLIPTTIPTGVPETTISQVGSTAGSTDGKLLSAAPSLITSTTTSSAMRLMTLATAADKILKGKKEEQSDAPDKDVNVPLIIAASDGSTPAVGHVNEDGTIELTLDATSPERLSLIQQQIALTPSSDSCDEPKSKKNKKRQQLPDSMKTPNYWERRRKNNEAAKRSRDARRAKEDQIAIRAAILEHENTRLKIELKALKEETAKLRAEIYERKQADSK